ncbi:leucine-rich_repeat domain-containing protein [Hexamita inflata]|uniref:Leucine-rich repeat domain-containing protein n=1 Tax=Hexamita inflata TaxID=28002 RepID=A0AA86R7A8_9EUKA|nr:leucine-rich repeat domain-containing protein [Hexamita inflata]CAI9968571.1 leucine-rich repeat domain-containing protein [Hexamita inflata]
MEEQIVDNEKFYCVRSDTNLADKQIDNIANMKVNQLYYPSISQIPVHITKLIASGCCLQEISGVRFMKNLSYLDISNNFIKNISDLQYLQNLQYLNMTNNKIIFSQPLSALPMLQQLLLASNMIHDFDTIATNPNFNINWICPQNIAQIRNFMDFLGSSSTIEQATLLMNNTISRRDQSPHHDPMLLKYAPMVVNKTLVIYNDQELRSIQFTDFLNIETLFVFECYNLSFERVPTKIKKLAVNMCYIENINRLEQMKSVVELSLRGNRISEIGVLSGMNQLQKLDMAQNNLKSIRGIEQLINLIEIDLSENTITDINCLKFMKQLKSVNLSKNKITLAEDLESLTNLLTLKLSNNNLNRINFVKPMKNLLHLDVSFNQIKDIDVIKDLVKLVDLRLDGNKIESFGALESLPNFKWSWYVSEQNAPESDNTRIIIKKCLNKPLATISDNQQIKQFGFVDFCKTQHVSITNCANISFEKCPRIPIKLKINKCGLQAITGIFEMQQIVELDLGFNNIRHIDELEALINIQELNLQNNDIYRINSLGSLNQLKYVNLTNNKVIFSQPLNQMKDQLLIDNNLISDNVTLKNQNKPQLVDYQNFLGPNSTEDQAKELSRIVPSDQKYDQRMKQKYIQSVVNNALQIQNDQTLTYFGFTNEMNINTLNIQNCQNVKLPFQTILKFLKTENGALINYPEVVLNKIPSQITSFTINSCKLTNIVGIENMKQLQYLNLKDNQIVSIEQLQKLSNLKQVLVDNNFIQDLEYLTNQDWISLQKAPRDSDLTAYLTDTNSILTLEAFKAQIAPKKAKSDQLIAPLLYDSDMQSKYQPQVNYNKLEIFSDTSIKDIKFMDQISFQCLILNKCTNFSFRRAPTQLLYLTLNDCNISDLEGLQQFKQLKKFESINNKQLTSIKQVYSLTNLLSLTINNTKINNLFGIEQLSKLQYIDLRDNCIVSIEPVKSLQYLKQVLIDNNFIQDLEHLTTTKNYNPEWIYYQNAITDSELARYLTDTQSKMSLLELKTSFEGKKMRTDELIRDHPAAYDAKMKAKYLPVVQENAKKYPIETHPNGPNGYGPCLRIDNDSEIRDLHFVSELGVADLYLTNCQNAHPLRAPTNLRRLVHYPSGMKTAKGVERLLGLESLSIENAQIVELNIRGLEKLRSIWVDNNKIRDMSAAKYLKAKGCCSSNYKIDCQKQPSQEEIDEARLW